MAVEQTKIYELDLYEADLDANEVMIAVGHSSWTRPKRFPMASILTGSAGDISVQHIESDRLSGLASRSVTVTFDSAFDSQPIGDVWVFRMAEVATGKWRKQNVLWGFTNANQPTTTGFSLVIDSSESLTGIIIEYLYK